MTRQEHLRVFGGNPDVSKEAMGFMANKSYTLLAAQGTERGKERRQREIRAMRGPLQKLKA
jgi:hypothetical protein